MGYYDNFDVSMKTDVQAPSVKVDGFPVAITADLSVGRDLSDKGTGIGDSRGWTQSEIEAAANRAAAVIKAHDPSRVS